ncbi:MAG: glycosyltransferase [Paludibacteraceae bacterium]|nr:glycosyltransferase [Paludibacteraceae bacterium]
MKILFVIDDYVSSNNGTTISCRRFVSELQKLGHDVRILGICNSEETKCFHLEQYHVPIFGGLIQKYDFKFAKIDSTILRNAIGWADLVHCMMPFALTYRCIPIIKELKKASTSAFHIQPENILSAIHLAKCDFANRCLYALWRKKIYRHFQYIHCPSMFMANELKKQSYSGDIRAISNGISTDFTQLNHYKSIEYKDKIVITMVGRLAREKRQDLIINAVAKSKYSDKIQIVFAGKGPLKDYYMNLAKARTLKNSPQFVYYNQKELLDLLAQTDLYIHASDMESEAIACIEAFATGLVPIISDSKQSATKVFAVDKRSLFKAGDSDDLARKIDYWLEHSEEKHLMEKQYAQLAIQYSLKSSVQKFVEMCEEAFETLSK